MDQKILIAGMGNILRRDDGFGVEVARQLAVELLHAYLTEERGLTPEESYAVISATGDLELGGPANAIVLGSVPWSVFEGLG